MLAGTVFFRRRTPGHPFPLTHKFIQSTADLWKSYVQHEFVVQLGKGELDRASFIHFIKYAHSFLRHVYESILDLAQAGLSLFKILFESICVGPFFF